MENHFIINNKEYSFGKDLDGKQHSIKELQDILLKIVLEFDRICRKYKIPYALTYGSALGLFNYAGFIPWDDDIDISIDYFDIPRLIKALNEDLGEDFTFDCYEENKRYNVLIPTFKIRYKHSYIREVNQPTLPNRCKNGDGIFIDVVAFMGVPSNEKEHKKILKYSKRRMIPYVVLDAFLRIHPYTMKKKLKAFEKEMAYEYKDSPFVSQTVIIPFQDWGKEKKNKSFPKEVLYPVREYDFCGHKLFSYNDLETFIKLCYGEKSMKKEVNGVYIDPFPNRKRKTKHVARYLLDTKKTN